MARAITVEFLGNSRDLTNAMDQAESKGKRFSSTMGKVGKGLAIGLGAGLVAGAAGLAKLTQGAIEDEAAQTKLANALKNTAGANDAQIASVEKWISAQGVALGVTDDELRPAMEKLVGATGSVEEAQRQMAIAMDAAAGRGVSLETVTKAMEKANNGNVGALAKLGIETKNAAGETISLEEANDRLAKKFKGAAATAADTTAGKMGRLKLILGEAGEEIGAKLIPVVTKMADWFLNKGLPAIQRFGGYLQEKLPPIFERVKTVVVDLFNKIKGPAKEAFTNIKAVVKDFISIVRALWKKFGGNIMEYARGTFNNIKNIISGAFKIIKGIFKVFTSLFKGDWKGAWDGIKSIVKGAGQMLRGIIGQLFTGLRLMFKNAWTAIKMIVGGAWEGIKTLVAKGFTAVIEYIKGIPAKIGALKDKFLNMGKELIGQFVEGLKGAAGLVSDVAGNIWDSVKGLLNSAIGKINDALEFRIEVFGKGVTINPPDIPALAKGGIVRARRGGTLALIGEGGHDEAVVPLSGPHAPRMTGATGGLTVNFNGPVYGDPRAFARFVRTELLKEKRLLGTSLGLG